jgi:hypothetical protein
LRGLERERKNKTGNKRKNRAEEKESRRETQRKKEEPPTSQRHGTQPQHRPPLGRGSTSSSSSSSSPGCSTVHVACEKWRVSLLFVLVFWAGQRWPSTKWLGRVRPNQEKKILQKNILKNMWFSRIFFYWIFLSIGLYFYTVKIQI